MQRNLIGQVIATLGALVALVGTFLPWLRSGTRGRSSYEIFSLVDRLGISQSSVVGWGVRLWPVVPFLLVLAVTFEWFPRRWLTGAAVGVAIVYAGVVSVAVMKASSNSLITSASGPVVTLVGVVLLGLGALLPIVVARAGARRAEPLSNRP